MVYSEADAVVVVLVLLLLLLIALYSVMVFSIVIIDRFVQRYGLLSGQTHCVGVIIVIIDRFVQRYGLLSGQTHPAHVACDSQ